jgi:AcrR family transcriptional regulator
MKFIACRIHHVVNTSQTTASPRRTGRRQGPSGTRDAILASARRLFAERGFDGVSMRAIAADADVDPALVHHYFDGKERLFVAALELPIDPSVAIPGVIGGDLAGAGARLVGFFLSVWDDPATRAPLEAILRSAVTDPEARVARPLARIVLQPIAEAVAGDEAELRACLCASQILGLALVRYILRLEPLASAPAAVVVHAIGPSLQRSLTGRLAEPAAS